MTSTDTPTFIHNADSTFTGVNVRPLAWRVSDLPWDAELVTVRLEDVQPGDRVAIYSRGRVRLAQVSKVGKSNVTTRYTTETSRHAVTEKAAKPVDLYGHWPVSEELRHTARSEERARVADLKARKAQDQAEYERLLEAVPAYLAENGGRTYSELSRELTYAAPKAWSRSPLDKAVRHLTEQNRIETTDERRGSWTVMVATAAAEVPVTPELKVSDLSEDAAEGILLAWREGTTDSIGLSEEAYAELQRHRLVGSHALNGAGEKMARRLSREAR